MLTWQGIVHVGGRKDGGQRESVQTIFDDERNFDAVWSRYCPAASVRADVQSVIILQHGGGRH